MKKVLNFVIITYFTLIISEGFSQITEGTSFVKNYKLSYDNINNNKIEFFGTLVDRNSTFKNVLIKFKIPSHARLYQKTKLNGNKTVASIKPFNQIKSKNDSTLIIKFSEIKAPISPGVDFHIIPIAEGKGKIKASLSYSYKGEKISETFSSGFISANSPPIKWKLCQNNNQFYLDGSIQYNYDATYSIPENGDYRYTLKSSGDQYELDEYFIPFDLDKSIKYSINGRMVAKDNNKWVFNEKEISVKNCKEEVIEKKEEVIEKPEEPRKFFSAIRVSKSNKGAVLTNIDTTKKYKILRRRINGDERGYKTIKRGLTEDYYIDTTFNKIDNGLYQYGIQEEGSDRILTSNVVKRTKLKLRFTPDNFYASIIFGSEIGMEASIDLLRLDINKHLSFAPGNINFRYSFNNEISSYFILRSIYEYKDILIYYGAGPGFIFDVKQGELSANTIAIDAGVEFFRVFGFDHWNFNVKGSLINRSDGTDSKISGLYLGLRYKF